jgi:hypothetical protein
MNAPPAKRSGRNGAGRCPAPFATPLSVLIRR